MSMRRPRLLAACALLASFVAACSGESKTQAPRGNPEQGRELIQRVGCGSCHSIPGVNGAKGRVGPPLDNLARRAYLAGVLPNNFENLVAWLQEPRKIAPNTAMPNTGLELREAEDVAAYLYGVE